jgi:predicted secreted protein
MTSSLRHPERLLPGLTGLGILLVLVLLVSGCTLQPPAPPTTTSVSVTPQASLAVATTAMADAGKKMVTFTEADNGKTGTIAQNTRFAIELAENPTTGYQWNATLSPGLELQSTDYRQSQEARGMAGSGGTRTWIILAKDLGDQKFSASYRRSWEKATGNEMIYSVDIQVVKV